MEYFVFIKEGYKSISKHLNKQGYLKVLATEGVMKKSWYGSLREGLMGLLDIKN